MTKTGTSARRAAFEALKRTQGGAYSTIALDSAISSSEMDDREKALSSAIFYGVLESETLLDSVIDVRLRPKNRRLENDVRTILRMGVYQLACMDKIPESAAVFESVRLAKQVGLDRASGFINGILRGFVRDGKKLPAPGSGKGTVEQLSREHSCPEWLVRLFGESYGEELCRSILSSFSGRAPMFARVNIAKTDVESLMAALGGEGVSAEKVKGFDHALALKSTGDVEKLESYRKGLFHIQDISSQLCCELLDPRDGETVIDVCAAPGGKSFTTAQLAKCSVVSCDLYPQRVKLVSDGKIRLGLDNVRTLVRDALDGGQSDMPTADKILCDVPCSGLGVIRRKPDIKNKSPRELSELPALQYDILSNSSRFLKKGGRLVYSTCTLNPTENAGVFERFLTEHTEYEPFSLVLPDGIVRRIAEPEYMLTLFPEKNGSDGFFIAAAVRRE